MPRSLLLAALLVGCSSTPPTASSPAQQRAVEARLADLLAAAAAPDASPETIAPFLIARTDDDARQWKVAVDPSRPGERAHAESVLGTLRGLMDGARGPSGGVEYETLEFVVEPESEGIWHVLRVEFKGGERPVEGFFAFLPLGGTYLLGDIER